GVIRSGHGKGGSNADSLLLANPLARAGRPMFGRLRRDGEMMFDRRHDGPGCDVLDDVPVIVGIERGTTDGLIATSPREA
ncbi:hypothetical protein AB4144_31415, partial [Rhizobiaceae sp. 2RAB30]